MRLSDLVGEHVLTGVDLLASEDDANGIAFVLDERAYLVAEDPIDGYRSAAGDIVEVAAATIKNTFAPVRVLARLTDDILELIDLVTGKTVLEVGTNDEDHYYPCYVANFMPENMAINVGHGEGAAK